MIGYGIAASIAVHVLLALLAALWFGLVPIPQLNVPKVEDEPEVTLLFPQSIQLAPETPKQTEAQRYIRTTQNTAEPAAPGKSDFVSDRNTVASARLPADEKGTSPMPTTKGVEVPTFELSNRDYVDGDLKEDSAPSPMPTPPATPTKPQPQTSQTSPAQEAQKTSPAPQPKPVEPEPKLKDPDPDIAKPVIAKKEDSPTEAMMKELDKKLEENSKDLLPVEMPPKQKADEPPAPKPEPEVRKAIAVPEPIANTPKPQKDAFQPQTRVSANKGTVNTPGLEDSVDAQATPKGVYMRQVTGAIEKRWHFLRRQRAEFVEPGRLRLRFYVSKNGKIRPQDISIVSNKANPILADFTLTAILQASVPPIPENLLSTLEDERLEIEYDVVIY